MAQFRKKNIGNNAIGADQLALESGKFLKAEKADKSGYIDILKLNENDSVEFVVTPTLPAGNATQPNQIIKLSQLESEKQALAAADQQLQSEIDALELASEELRTDLTALSSQTSGATSSLSGRLDTLELDPVTKSYVDTSDQNLDSKITTEKNRVDAILLASQADKDSFAEIVNLINSVDTETDSAFASYVISNNARVTTAEQNIAQEILDRQADVNSEESRAVAAENNLQSQITTEISDRQAADATTLSSAKTYADNLHSTQATEIDAVEASVALEITNRTNADQSLQTQITALDGNLTSLSNTVDALDVYAQETRVDLDALDVYAQEIRSDLDQEIIDRTSANSNLSSNISNLEADLAQEVAAREAAIIAVESSLANETARATNVEQQLSLNIQAETTRATGAEAGLQSQINTEKGRVDAILLAADADKDSFKEIVDLINLVDTTNDSAFGAYVVSNNAALAQEVADRQAADQNIQTQINNLNSTFATDAELAAAILAEQTARSTATDSLQEQVDDLDALVLTLQDDVDTLNAQVPGFVSGLSSEITRAQNAEAALDSRLDVLEPKVSTLETEMNAAEAAIAQEVLDRGAAINAEALLRTNADAALQSSIDAEKSRIDAILSASEADKNSFAEIVSLINSVDTTNDQAFASYVLSNDAAVALKAEKTYVDSQDAAKLVEAKAYTDAQIAAIPAVDLSSYETIANVDSKDAAKLVEAKAYTDSKIAAIPSVDLSGYYTKSEIDTKESALDSRIDTLEAFGYEQLVYVSKNGSDSNTGKQHSPFLTITAAMNAISDASPTKRYAIKVAAGNYSEAIALKANVFIVGEGQKESVRITGAVSMGSSFTANSSFDNRSGFGNLTLLSAANFDWNTVQSAAGKLYFSEVVFGSTVNMNGYNNAIAQSQFNSCVIFGALTISGINVAVFTNNVCYGNINLNQHPNGGMATILVATGGYCQGTITQTATVNDFNRRSASFLRHFNSEQLVLNGPSVYADVDLVSQGKQLPTISNGANLIALNPTINHDLTSQRIVPKATNSHNMGDWGAQWMFNFGYVHASSGTDLYLTSVDSSYDSAGSSTGYSINIEADGYGLKPNVNGGDVKIVTATPSGTGTRGKVQLNGSEIDVTSKKITNLADGTISTDAINKGQLDSVQNGLQSQITTEKGRVDAILLAADADKDSFAEIVSLINSVDAASDSAFAGYVVSNNAAVAAIDTRLTTAESDITAVEAQLAEEISNRISDVNAEESRALAAEGALQSAIATEQSARVSADNALDLRLDALELDPVAKTYVDSQDNTNFLNAKAYTDAQVLVEKTRAEAAEADFALDLSDLEAYAYDIRGDLDQEILDRVSAVSAEISARQTADSTLQTSINNEISARQSADTSLQSEIDAVELNLSNEISRATSAEAQLQSNINTEKSRVDAILSASQADKDSFAEIVTLINSVDTTNNNAFASYVLSNDAAVASLDSRLDALEPKVATLESEMDAAQTDLTSLDGRLDIAEPKIATLETKVSTLESEMNQAQSDIVALDGRLDTAEPKISTLELDLSSAESNIATLQSQMISAQADIVALDSRLDIAEPKVSTLESKMSIAESDINSLETGLSQETAARQNADISLQSDIDALDVYAQEVRSDLDSLDVYAQEIRADLDSLTTSSSATQLSLTQEIANRIAADATTLSSANTYTDSKVATETSARQAADAQLDLDISAEETRASAAEAALSSGLSQEIADRQAADTVLDGKISTEKSRIDAILLASDADKDSFTEIVSLINSVDTTNDQAFAGYVLSNNARSTAIENNLTQEISDRQAGDTATLASANAYTDSAKSDLDQDVADLVADLAQEVADRQSAVSSEAATRSSADANLQGMITAEETSRIAADQNLQSQITQEASARAAADSSLQNSLTSEITRATNAETTLSQSIAAETSRATAAEGTLQNEIDTLDVYAQEIRVDLDDLEAYALDIRNDLDQELIDRAAADTTLSSQITALQQSTNIANQNLSELIAIETAARETAIANLLSNTDPAALDSLSEVVTAFQAADNNLNNAISALGTSASSALASEIARAQAAEASLQTQITSEVSRATTAETTIANNLSTEITDRQSAVNAEQLARIAADQNLQTQINSIISNTDPAAIDSFVEVVAAFQAADSNINNAITSLASSASSALSAEITRAQTAEGNLQNQINTLSSTVSTNESTLDGRLDILEADPVTKTYVDGGVTTLQNQINFITANTDPAMLDSLTEVVTAFQQADSDLQNAISILTFGVSNQITVEQTARITADNALSGRITTLENRNFAKKTITIAGNYAFVDLDHNANVNSIIGFKNRIPFHLSHDFTTSVVSGKTRLTWIGDFASGQSQALVDGDKIFLTYYY